jgi:hypothetical protein
MLSENILHRHANKFKNLYETDNFPENIYDKVFSQKYKSYLSRKRKYS